jgi:hypothetical protein
MEGWQHTFQTN